MYHFIVNPDAGNRKSIKALEVVAKVFKEYGETYVIHKTEKMGGLRVLVSKDTVIRAFLLTIKKAKISLTKKRKE